MNGYFGVKYDAPAWDDAPELPTPVGQKCLLCEEEVLDGESGVIIMAMGPVGVGPAPQHIECFLRSILGSVAHLEGRCICSGGTVEDMDDRPYRVQARETMDRLTQEGMRRAGE